MKFFLLLTAGLLSMLGAVTGGIFVAMAALYVFENGMNWAVLALLPLSGISFVLLIIGGRYLRSRDAKSAESLAAAIGVSAWLILSSTVFGSIGSGDRFFALAFAAPIICGIVLYKLLHICIQRTFTRRMDPNAIGNMKDTRPGDTN